MTLNDNRKHITATMKKKIALYEPLDFKTTRKRFLQRLQTEDYKMPRDIPRNCRVNEHLDCLIKNFLIENAYYALTVNYIPRIIMNKLGIFNPNDVTVQDTVDFVRERLEKDELARLKRFSEKAKFKTFLTTAVIRLLFDSWRRKGTVGKNVKRYESDFDAIFDPPVDDPLAVLIQSEDDRFKQKAAAFLPQVLDKLDPEEKLAIKMKYEKNMKTSAIARTLDFTRFKTVQLLKQTQHKIARELLKKINENQKGGSSETP
jgi:RNA polymerase sigma factor (sigma-70 family)